MVFRLLLLCSTLLKKERKKDKKQDYTLSFSFIHSFIHPIHLSPPPTQPTNPTHHHHPSAHHPPPNQHHPNMPTPPTHRLTHLLLPLLSITLNLAILGTSSRTLHIYQTSQTSNVYFLPIWNSHFDMRGLQTLVGTSVGIVVLNGIFAVGAVVCGNGGGNEGGRGRGMVCFFLPLLHSQSKRLLTIFFSIHPQLQLPTNTILLASSLSSTLLSIIALALQATLNHQSPQRDTLQTWTCMWKNVQGEGVPQSFDTLCHETVSSTFNLTSQNRHKTFLQDNHDKKTDILNLLIALCILHDYSELSHPAQPSRAGWLCSDGEKCYFGAQEEVGDSTG